MTLQNCLQYRLVNEEVSDRSSYSKSPHIRNSHFEMMRLSGFLYVGKYFEMRLADFLYAH